MVKDEDGITYGWQMGTPATTGRAGARGAVTA